MDIFNLAEFVLANVNNGTYAKKPKFYHYIHCMDFVFEF